MIQVNKPDERAADTHNDEVRLFRGDSAHVVAYGTDLTTVRAAAAFGLGIGVLLGVAVAFFLVFPLRGFGSDPIVLYAPELTGDGQTGSWRIISEEQSRQKPWTAVGNFLIPGVGGYCSAVLVGPRVVLTANHCLYALDYRKRDANGNPTKQLMDPRLFVFVAGVHDNSFVDLIPVEEAITGGWEPGSNDTSKDWLIAILRRPASQEIAPIPIRPYQPQAVAKAWRDKLVLAAYPGDSFAFNGVLRFSFHCSMLKSDSTSVLSHDCPAEGGSSGGPILVEEQGEWRLVGIHSSTQSSDSQHKNAVSINSVVGSLKDVFARLD